MSDYIDLNGEAQSFGDTAAQREAVSYTHLDVYKRQPLWCRSG